MNSILKQLKMERKPLAVALFLFGALIFLRFVIFAPNATGSAGISALPRQSPEFTILIGSAQMAFEDGSDKAKNEELPVLALLSSIHH